MEEILQNILERLNRLEAKGKKVTIEKERKIYQTPPPRTFQWLSVEEADEERFLDEEIFKLSGEYQPGRVNDLPYVEELEMPDPLFLEEEMPTPDPLIVGESILKFMESSVEDNSVEYFAELVEHAKKDMRQQCLKVLDFLKGHEVKVNFALREKTITKRQQAGDSSRVWDPGGF